MSINILCCGAVTFEIIKEGNIKKTVCHNSDEKKEWKTKTNKPTLNRRSLRTEVLKWPFYLTAKLNEFLFMQFPSNNLSIENNDGNKSW